MEINIINKNAALMNYLLFFIFIFLLSLNQAGAMEDMNGDDPGFSKRTESLKALVDPSDSEESQTDDEDLKPAKQNETQEIQELRAVLRQAKEVLKQSELTHQARENHVRAQRACKKFDNKYMAEKRTMEAATLRAEKAQEQNRQAQRALYRTKWAVHSFCLTLSADSGLGKKQRITGHKKKTEEVKDQGAKTLLEVSREHIQGQFMELPYLEAEAAKAEAELLKAENAEKAQQEKLKKLYFEGKDLRKIEKKLGERAPKKTKVFLRKFAELIKSYNSSGIGVIEDELSVEGDEGRKVEVTEKIIEKLKEKLAIGSDKAVEKESRTGSGLGLGAGSRQGLRSRSSAGGSKQGSGFDLGQGKKAGAGAGSS